MSEPLTREQLEAVQAAHRPMGGHCAGCFVENEDPTPVPWPCLPFRLAETALAALKRADDAERAASRVAKYKQEAVIMQAEYEKQLKRADAAEARVQRVRALADEWEQGALRWAQPLPVPPEVARIRAALDGDQHAPEQPTHHTTDYASSMRPMVDPYQRSADRP
jgi:hypothetical protein